jgi:hypothetical protein
MLDAGRSFWDILSRRLGFGYSAYVEESRIPRDRQSRVDFIQAERRQPFRDGEVAAMSSKDSAVTAGDLRGMALFSDLNDDQLKSTSAIARFAEALTGALLLREGDPADSIRVIVKGRVSLTITVPGRKDKTVTTLSRGHLLGWSALIPGSRWVASATALKPCLMVEIPAAKLLDLCERDFELGYRLMKNAMAAVAERLSETRLLVLDMYGESGE